MYCVATKDTIAIAHALEQLPEDHKCNSVHGHNYGVEIRVWATELNEYGFVVDFSEIKKVLKKVKEDFDHKLVVNEKNTKLNINELEKIFPGRIKVIDFDFTAENFAKYICWNYAYILRNHNVKKITVRVYETEKSFAMFVMTD